MWNRQRLLGVPRSALALGLALAWCACTGENPAPLVSTPGDTPERIVVLDPGIAEVFIHVGATKRLVGRPAFTDHLPEIAQVPRMGTALTPNYEPIVRTSPDLILATGSRGKVLRDLENIAPTHSIPWLTAEEVTQGIRTLGSLIGQEEATDALAASMEAGLAPTTTADSPRVLVLLGPPSETDAEIWFAKAGSLHGSALQAAGGVNAVSEAVGGPPSLSIEGLMKADPDIILILIPNPSGSELSLDAHLAFWKRFPMLQAVENDRVAFLVGSTHFSTGPGVLDFKTALSEKISALEKTAR